MTGELYNIPFSSLALGYILILVPLSLVLFYRLGAPGEVLISVIRMTVQLVFVGFYLQVVFELDRWWLTSLWLLAMIVVADLSVIRGAGLSLRRFLFAIFAAILAGTLIPLVYFIAVILRTPGLLEPQYVIPIGGMIMGNCLRANIIGIGRFYRSIKERENAFLYTLGQGATLREAVRPFMSRAITEALAPTIATMMTIGLVSLPGIFVPASGPHQIPGIARRGRRSRTARERVANATIRELVPASRPAPSPIPIAEERGTPCADIKAEDARPTPAP